MKVFSTDLYLEMLHEELQKVERQRLPLVQIEEVKVMVAADVGVPEAYVRSPVRASNPKS